MGSKKTLFIVAWVLIVSMISLGCTESDSNEEKTVSQSASASSQDLANSAQPKETSTSQTTETVNQDLAWAEYVQKYSPLLGTDFSNAGNAASNYDYDSLATDGQNIVTDTQKALDENSKYTVSSKYQEAQKEWELALKDYNSAGQYMIIVANEGKAGSLNSENINKAASFSESGTGHLNRASALVKANI